jgi:hypothetical protein
MIVGGTTVLGPVELVGHNGISSEIKDSAVYGYQEVLLST